jgi:hypothetical protein
MVWAWVGGVGCAATAYFPLGLKKISITGYKYKPKIEKSWDFGGVYVNLCGVLRYFTGQ